MLGELEEFAEAVSELRPQTPLELITDPNCLEQRTGKRTVRL